MPGHVPPHGFANAIVHPLAYALQTFAFPLPALASCAGRAPLGGDREMALGVWMAARLALGMLPPVALTSAERTLRAEKAKHWVASLTMPNPARLALFRSYDATATYPPQAAEALSELGLIIAGHIDAASQEEVASLVARLKAVDLGLDSSLNPPAAVLPSVPEGSRPDISEADSSL